ncbi:hypothetical protein CPLU01_03810 [Colletotrichum plurivorum]|uniref:Uncharacterized protein n=1 Tax=Colletotrichum plurivorum TaxID=2175906 RepID=A0A8H6NJV7_9PEZI|nr:hypothetical protein CPLU01_03810 [Colletotrichum plurivorum]
MGGNDKPFNVSSARPHINGTRKQLAVLTFFFWNSDSAGREMDDASSVDHGPLRWLQHLSASFAKADQDCRFHWKPATCLRCGIVSSPRVSNLNTSEDVASCVRSE